MITADSIEDLKNRLDVVDVVGGYIELKKAGANFKAPCPFHDEKSPSFVISPQKQIYHCFGCGAGGDSIKFVMEYEKLSYPEAIEKLADQYNFTLQYTQGKSQAHQKSKLLDQLNSWYQTLLNQKPTALDYLKNRGIFNSSIERFGIGYAPSSPENINFLNAQFLPLNEAVELGVIGHDNDRYFARFIERITFPIHANNGNVIGFGGRTITGHQAKYINSPQTKLFNKSRQLYAYHLARESIYKKEMMIVTEGYLDVVMLHQAGFTQAVATLGTALTNEHLPLLRKGNPKIVMAYDGDNAGRNAALKAARMLSVSGFDGGVILFAEGLDPADMVKEGKLEQLNNLFNNPQPFIAFVLDQIVIQYNIQDPKAKEKALNECSLYLKSLSALLQEEYKSYVASKLAISPRLVNLHKKESPQTNNQNISTQNSGDTWELSLVKTVLEYPNFIDQILDVLNPSFLYFHPQELHLALQGETSHPTLMALLINESIKSFSSEEHLRAELIDFLGNYYQKELKKIQQSNKGFEEKSFLIRKYRGVILELKKGNLTTI
jgi:DNA primase